MALTLKQNAIQIRTICCYLHKVENLLDLIPEDIESSIGSMASVPLLSLPEFSVNTHKPIRKKMAKGLDIGATVFSTLGFRIRCPLDYWMPRYLVESSGARVQKLCETSSHRHWET